MEAVWTRFQPVSYKVQEVLSSGAIGELRSVQAELSVNLDAKTRDPSHRMVRVLYCDCFFAQSSSWSRDGRSTHSLREVPSSTWGRSCCQLIPCWTFD